GRLLLHCHRPSAVHARRVEGARGRDAASRRAGSAVCPAGNPGRRSDLLLRTAARASQGAVAAAPAKTVGHALPAWELGRRHTWVHGAFQRLPPLVRTRAGRFRIRAAVPAAARARPRLAAGEFAEAPRRLPPVWRLAPEA